MSSDPQNTSLSACASLVFVGGTLQINGPNFGARSGQGSLTFSEDDLECALVDHADKSVFRVDLARSELIALRDFLNSQLPMEAESHAE